MFKFLHIFKPQSQVTQAKDNIIFENSSQYLYFDVEENNAVTRKVVKSPIAASEVPYGNSDVATALGGKVDAVSGKGLSTEDYTTAEQTKLSGIEAGAEVNTIETVKVNGTALTPDANRAVDVTVPTTFNASAITSGVFDIARIPAAALERIVHVANQAARFALTPSDVQLGDTVQQDDTGVMYIVVDLSALDSGLGYNEYYAGNAAMVNGHTVDSNVPSNATFISRDAANGGTDLSLVTTGEKYEWNKQASSVISVTLDASSWSVGTYTVTNSAITATCNGYIGLSSSATATQRKACRDAMMTITAQAAGSLTLTADGTVPTVDVPIDIILIT